MVRLKQYIECEGYNGDCIRDIVQSCINLARARSTNNVFVIIKTNINGVDLEIHQHTTHNEIKKIYKNEYLK